MDLLFNVQFYNPEFYNLVIQNSNSKESPTVSANFNGHIPILSNKPVAIITISCIKCVQIMRIYDGSKYYKK